MRRRQSQAHHLVHVLGSFTVTPTCESGDKLTRFGPFSSQCRVGHVKIRRGAWNEELFRVLDAVIQWKSVISWFRRALAAMARRADRPAHSI